MLIFEKVASEIQKNKKLPFTLTTVNFQAVFMNKFKSNSILFEIKTLFVKGFITKNKLDEENFCLPSKI